MIKKALNITNGIKVKTVFDCKKSNPHRHHITVDSQEKVNWCLSCTKPASECKGNCFGKS